MRSQFLSHTRYIECPLPRQICWRR